MKINAFIAAVLLITPLTIAQAKTNSDLYNDICQWVENDDHLKINRTLKSQGKTINSVYPYMSCEQQNILEFAKEKNSENTVDYIERKLYPKYLK
ncbi:DUF3718 domain-containing protein [Colwellia sp. MEBiC06753]